MLAASSYRSLDYGMFAAPAAMLQGELCSAKTSAAIMRHSFPMSICDEFHTKCPALESDNHVAPCTGAVEDVTKVS